MSSSRALDASESESTMRELVESGRQARENAIKNYEHALEFYTNALDLQATTFQALGKLDHAVKNAEWILELAPRLPDGYLRLGNFARLQKNDKYACELYAAGIEVNKDSAIDSSPKLQQLYTLYRHVLRQDPLCLPADIVSHIFSYLSWTELLGILCVSKEWNRKLTSPMQSKLWRNINFPYIGDYWPELDYVKKILSWAGEGGARKIVTKNWSELPDDVITQMLESSPSLEHLVLHNMPCQGLPAHNNKWTQLRYISLSGIVDHFVFKEVDRDGGFPQTFIQNAASSLEHLNFVGIPSQWYRGMMPHLPHLKTLQIGGWRDDSRSFPTFRLSVAFPSLEQLCIGPNVPFLVHQPASTWQTRWRDVWPHLKVLKFHDWMADAEDDDLFEEVDFGAQIEIGEMEDEREDTRLTLRYLMALNSLQHISLKLEGEDWPFCTFRHKDEDLLHDVDVAQLSDFRNLRSFESPSFSITPDGGRILLSKAVMAKQLTSFDLVFPKERYESLIYDDSSASPDESLVEGSWTVEDPDTAEEDPCTIEEKSIQHLKGYEWLSGTPSIHTLGLYGFRFPVDSENDEDSPLLRFLATFPNLRTLKINSREYDTPDFVSLVVSIMRVTHLETIYTICVGGDFSDQLRKTAQEHGVQLMSKVPEQEWDSES